MLNIVDMKFHPNIGSGVFEYEYSIDSYVQDSLIMQLDGIKNTRSGHNSEASVWEDLVGNVNFTKTNYLSFGDNCILVNYRINSDNTIVVPDEFTMEVIYQYDGSNHHTIGFSGRFPFFKGRRDLESPWWLRATIDRKKGLRYTDSFGINATHSIALTQNSEGGKCYHNGVLSASNSNVATYSSEQNLINHDNNGEVLTGKIFAIRLYKRALTAEELAQNYEIDKIRFNLPKIYGVSWDGTSTTAFSRTDDAELFTDPVPYVSGASSYGSPFDNISPWKDMKIVEDSIAGKLVSIPKYYYKWTKTGDSMKLQISAEPFDGSLVSPAHADRGDGVGERDVVYVGRYHCNSSYKSAAGSNPLGKITRATARTNIHNLGSTYWQYDFAMYWTIAMLYLVEFADWDSQEKIGYGCSTNGRSMSVGYTDSMPYHTGTTASARTSYGGTQYRYIEGLWDNVYDWCDGIYFSGANIYCTKNPSSFSDSSGGTHIGTRPTSTGLIKSWNVPTTSGFEYALYPTTVGGSNSTYTPDLCNYASSGVVLFVGGGYGQSTNLGLFCLHGYHVVSNSFGDVGCRLQKLP